MSTKAAGRIGLIVSLLIILGVAAGTARWIARSEAAACTTPISIEVVAIRQNVAHTAVECKDREKRVRENTSAVTEFKVVLRDLVLGQKEMIKELKALNKTTTENSTMVKKLAVEGNRRGG